MARQQQHSIFRYTARITLLIGKVFLWVALAFALISFTAVVMFRWIDPMTTGIKLQRQWEADGPWVAYHQWTDWDQIARIMSVAVIAAEDQRFLDHHGFDTIQIQKAIAASQRGERLRGASTISQQTAKNVFLWNGRSFLRKGLEAWFTLLIELCWSKQRILEVYLNSVEFGTDVFGVEAASKIYFQKSARQLDRYEAALLAAVLPNPHRLSANRPSEYVRERQYWILKQMQQLGESTLIDSLTR